MIFTDEHVHSTSVIVKDSETAMSNHSTTIYYVIFFALIVLCSCYPSSSSFSDFLVKNLRDEDPLRSLSSASLAVVGRNLLPDLPFSKLVEVGITVTVYDYETHSGALVRDDGVEFKQQVMNGGDEDWSLPEETLLLPGEVTLDGELLDVVASLRPDQRLVFLSSMIPAWQDDSEGDNFDMTADLFRTLQMERSTYRLRIGHLLENNVDSSGLISGYSSSLLDEFMCESMTLGFLDVLSPLFFPTNTFQFFTHVDDALFALILTMKLPIKSSQCVPSNESFHDKIVDSVAQSLCVRTAFVFNQLAAYSAAPVYFHQPPLSLMTTADQERIKRNIEFGNEVCSQHSHSYTIMPHESLFERFSNESVDDMFKLSYTKYTQNKLSICSPEKVSELKLNQQFGWMEKQLGSLVEQGFTLLFFRTDDSFQTEQKVITLSKYTNTPTYKRIAGGNCDLLPDVSDEMKYLAFSMVGMRVDRDEIEADLKCSLSQRSMLHVTSVVLVLWGENVPQALLNVLGPSFASTIETEKNGASPFFVTNGLQRHFLSHNSFMIDNASQGGLVFSMRGKSNNAGHSSRERRSRTILLTHMRNEEYLLPQWIRHNAPHFDLAILLDYNSSDQSLDIIRREAPSTWSVVQSKYAQFDCRGADEELMEIERQYPNDWKIVLTITEFIVLPSLRNTLLQSEFATKTLIRFPSYIMVGESHEVSSYQPHISLLLQRRHFAIDPSQPKTWLGMTIYSRYMHRRLSNRTHYGSGRHFMEHDGKLLTEFTLSGIENDARDDSGISFKYMTGHGFIAKYK